MDILAAWESLVITEIAGGVVKVQGRPPDHNALDRVSKVMWLKGWLRDSPRLARWLMHLGGKGRIPVERPSQVRSTDAVFYKINVP